MKRQARKLTAFSLSLLLTLVLTVMMLAGSFRLGVCNQTIFVRNVFDNDFYEDLYEQLDNDLKFLLWEEELPIELADNVFVDSQIYIDGKTYINSVLKGKEPKINTAKIEETLTKNGKAYLEKKAEQVGETKLKSIQKKIETIISETKQNYETNISLKLANYFYEFTTKYEKITTFILVGGLVLSAIFIVLLLAIYHRKYRALRYVLYATITATIANTLYVIYMTTILTVSNVTGNQLYYEMVENYLKEAGKQGYFVSLVGVVLVITTFLFIHMNKKKYKHL